MEQNLKIRNYEIDGIRGWAALLVVFYHFFWESYGVQYPLIRTAYFNFLLDGPLAVYVFFVLSGDALSNSFFQTRSTNSTVRLVLARYFRLTFLIVVSCLIVYLLMKLQLTFAGPAGVILGREDWLGIFITFPADLWNCIHYALFDVFFHHDVHTSYNPFLWTMSIELLGSILIFLNVFIFNHLKQPLLVLSIQFLFLAWVDSWMALFTFGMILGYLRSEGMLERFIRWKYSWLLSNATLLGVIVFDSAGNVKQEEIFAAYLIMACCLVAAFYTNRILIRFFVSKLSRFLGEISFPIYAIHFAVLVSIACWLTVLSEQKIILKDPVALSIPLLSCLISIPIAYLLCLAEKKFLKGMNKVAKSWMIEN